MRFTAATFNIRNGIALDGLNAWPFRRRSTARAVRSIEADVLGLQEAYQFQLRWLRRHFPDYQAVGEGRSPRGGGERCPVLVRMTRGRVIAHGTRWFGPTEAVPGSRAEGARFPRIATVARVRFDEGVDVEVASTHLDERSSGRRRASAAQLCEWLDGNVPRVVLGDLNARPGDAVFEVFAAHGLRAVVPQRGPGTVHGFTGRPTGVQIDHILVSEEFEILEARVFTEIAERQLPSDHWPVVAVLEVV